MLKVIELFAGVGAQAEALSRIGIDYKIIGISEIDKVMDGTISNTQLYKQAGNSIVVNVLEAVFREMFINQLDRKATKEEPKNVKELKLF